MPPLKDVLTEVNQDIRALSRMQEILAGVESLQFLAESHDMPQSFEVIRNANGTLSVELCIDMKDPRANFQPVVVNQLAADPEASDPGETVIETLEQARAIYTPGERQAVAEIPEFLKRQTRDRGKALPPEDLPHVAQDPTHPRAHWTPPNYPPLNPIKADNLTEADMRMHLVWLYSGEPNLSVIEQDKRIMGELASGRSHGEIAQELGLSRPWVTARVNELLGKDLHTPALIELALHALISLHYAWRLPRVIGGAA